jgi:hypothetical protein
MIKVYKGNKSLYLKMVGCALGCLFLERISTMVEIIVTAELPDLFQVSTFGNIGYSMFMFSANYGTFDSLTDDGSAALSKYRRMAWLAPLLFAFAAVIILISPANLTRSIPCAIEVLCLGATAYYDYKAVIIPDRYTGILSSLTPFHILSLIMALCLMNENIIWCYDVTLDILWALSYLPMYLIMPAITPVLVGGMNKWKV